MKQAQVKKKKIEQVCEQKDLIKNNTSLDSFMPGNKLDMRLNNKLISHK